MTTKSVYASINAVQTELAKIGISKTRRNTQGSGYNFRGIDDVLNALSSLMAVNKLVILPVVVERNQVERKSNAGGALFYTTVAVEYSIVSSVDGSSHVVKTYGEAMDSGDKSTNKAMSAAYKYMAIQTFAIPTEGDNDADAHTHEVQAETPASLLSAAKAAALEGRDAFGRFWKATTPADRNLLSPHIDSLKAAVESVEVAA